MMYSNSKKAGHWNVGVKHWNEDDHSRVGHVSTNREFAGRKKKDDAESMFKDGMKALMRGKLKKAKREFNLCLSHNLAHRQAPGHIEVADFYEKSQQVAEAALKFIGESSMIYKFGDNDAKAVKVGMARAGFGEKSAVAAFGIGRAYLTMATMQPGLDWDIYARKEFDRALSLLGKTKAEKYMAAAVHRIYAQAGDSELHLAKMRELDPHIPEKW